MPSAEMGRAARWTPGEPPAIAETHISVVAMIGDRAFKLLKPVAHDFVDFRDREARRRACLHELRVNRRFAPDVYLGVLDVVDGGGAPVDHLIAMRRMPAERRLSRLLGDAEGPERLREVAERVAELHARAPTSPQIARAGTPARVLDLWERGIAATARFVPSPLPAAEAERIAALAREYLRGRGPLLARRIADGRVRDGHGDLLADDIYCLPDGPRIIDCLAFDDELRHGDLLADIAFVAMDVEARGHPELAGRLLDWWTDASGDEHPPSLAHHYIAYRAHVRAKVACLRAEQGDERAPALARLHHRQALDHLERGRVRLVLVGGGPGTGKSSLAAALAQREGWTLLRSDELRKELAGLAPGERGRAGFGEGIYGSEHSERVYEELVARAERDLVLGETLVLDATWSARRHRAAAREGARRAGAAMVELRLDVPAELAARRIRERAARGSDPSDATPEIASRLARSADPWPEARAIDAGGPLVDVIAQATDALGHDLATTAGRLRR